MNNSEKKKIPFLALLGVFLAIVVITDQYITHRGILFDIDQIWNHEIVFVGLLGMAFGAIIQERLRT